MFDKLIDQRLPSGIEDQRGRATRGGVVGSRGIADRPGGIVDRTLGHVHPLVNPHYLLDPLNGLKVARAIHAKLVELRPTKKDYFDRQYAAFARRLGSALLGKGLTEKYEPEKILKLYEPGLSDFAADYRPCGPH